MPKRKATKIDEGMRRAREGEAPPAKRFFRQRAHINPLSQSAVYQYPISPERMDWSIHYPAFAGQLSTTDGTRPAKVVELADVGCGFGGLLMGLSPVLPETLCLGLEIRPKVTEYVRLRILQARRKPEGGTHANVSVLKSNAMKFAPHFFFKGQLTRMFFCFPDPHFKKAKHNRRIISTALLAEYAYCLKEGEKLYTITDVRDLHNWMVAHLAVHPCFERVSEEELATDPVVPIMRTYTEEGIRVEKMQGLKLVAVFRRVPEAKAIAVAETRDFWDEPEVDYVHIRVTGRNFGADHPVPPPTAAGAASSGAAAVGGAGTADAAAAAAPAAAADADVAMAPTTAASGSS